MHASSVFSFGLFLIAAFSVGVMAYLNRPLRLVLTDLCGTADRALFWRAFTNITLFVFPLLFMLDYRPEDSSDTAWLWTLADLAKRGLLGLVLTVVVLAIVMGSFIRRCDARPVAQRR
jgi:hypothetical protein